MEWISVKDRLPKITEKDKWENENKFSDKVVVIEQGKIYFGRFCYIFNGNWNVEGRLGNIQVTHWMPLPEPPKDE